MEITGKIIVVLPERGGVSKTGNEWKTQDYVLETHEQYPKRICFNVFGVDKIAQFNIKEGDELTVSFDINCREYQGRWFNDIRAWRVDRSTAEASGVAAAPAQASAVPSAAPAAPVEFSESNENDDLPF